MRLSIVLRAEGEDGRVYDYRPALILTGDTDAVGAHILDIHGVTLERFTEMLHEELESQGLVIKERASDEEDKAEEPVKGP